MEVVFKLVRLGYKVEFRWDAILCVDYMSVQRGGFFFETPLSLGTPMEVVLNRVFDAYGNWNSNG